MIPLELVPIGIIGMSILLFGPIVFLLDKWTECKKEALQFGTGVSIAMSSLLYSILWMLDTNGGDEIVSWAPIVWITLGAILIGSFIIYRLTEPNT